MEDIIIAKASEVKATHRKELNKYEYYKRELVPIRENGQCQFNLYEIPPNKATYPYHYHTKNEEVFYILQGKGLLRTPKGERIVTAGDFIYFPANANGAHQIKNISDENLIYLDFDTHNDIDVCFYPDTGKVGVWGRGVNQIYRIKDQVTYFDGEEAE
ncbi:MAG: cupin domain-containing protein [Clostridiales bacterium]|nr:cupin domain-containing protein [Clostridiales bacterium]